MPFEITKQDDCLFGRLSGVVTAADLDQLGTDTESLEDATPTAMDRICDIASVERFEVGFSAVNALAERRRVRKLSNSVKSAIIVKDLVQLGIARMFQTLNDNPQIEIRIFRSVAEAKEWFLSGRYTSPTGSPSR
jgi:hypothetical protein